MSIQTLKSGWLVRQSSVLKRWKKSWFVLFTDGNLAYFEDERKHERQGNFNIPGDCKCIKTALECEVGPPEGRNYGCLIKLVSRSGDDLVVASTNADEAIAWKLMLEQLVVSRPAQQVVRCPNTTYRTNQYPCTTATVRTARYPYRTVTTTTYYPAQQPAAYYPAQQPAAYYPSQQPAAYPQQPNAVGVQQVQKPTATPQSAPPSYQSQDRQQYTVQQPMYYNPTMHNGPVQVLYNSAGQPYYIHPNTEVVTVIHADDPHYYRRGDMYWGLAAGAMLGAALWTPFLFF